jgi:hypothetical protein
MPLLTEVGQVADARGNGRVVLSALVVVWLVSTVAAGCLLSVLGASSGSPGAAIP